MLQIQYMSFIQKNKIQLYQQNRINILFVLTVQIFLLKNSNGFDIQVIFPALSNAYHTYIYKDSIMQSQYNDSTYENILTCQNGQLSILQFSKDQWQQQIKIRYQGIQIQQNTINIEVQYHIPKPTLSHIDHIQKTIYVHTGCLGNDTNIHNYYNKVNVKIGSQPNRIQFAFLLGCDKGGRNKKFQLGYIVIAFINAAITIGVALHSKIWSIRYHKKPLSIELKWHRFVVMMSVVLILGIVLYLYAANQFKNANKIIAYIGLAISYIFSFICCDQIFFLVRVFKKSVYKYIRLCDIFSFITSTIMLVLGIMFDNWVYSNILALCMCVGAIKLFRFSSMKQAILSMCISIVFVTIVAIVLHFAVQRSYNDYATEISSPMFILIPDLVDQLYKKCSWLPVIDVIVPGVFLSFLRTYDENYNTGWGGVYTVIGNLSFISSTVLWILLQAVYPYSIPFSLVTYVFLGLSIWVISAKRNQLKTLWQGRFNGANNQLSTNLLSSSEHSQNRTSFSKLVTPDMMQSIKVGEDQNSQSVEQNRNNRKMSQ